MAIGGPFDAVSSYPALVQDFPDDGWIKAVRNFPAVPFEIVSIPIERPIMLRRGDKLEKCRCIYCHPRIRVPCGGRVVDAEPG